MLVSGVFLSFLSCLHLAPHWPPSLTSPLSPVCPLPAAPHTHTRQDAADAIWWTAEYFEEGDKDLSKCYFVVMGAFSFLQVREAARRPCPTPPYQQS